MGEYHTDEQFSQFFYPLWKFFGATHSGCVLMYFLCKLRVDVLTACLEFCQLYLPAGPGSREIILTKR